MRIVFCGTPEFAVPALSHLLAQTHMQVESVVTQPDRPQGRQQEIVPSPVKEAARAAGIPVFQPASIKGEEAFEFFKRTAPDAVVIIAYGQIIPARLLEIPRFGWINLHASLLPKYRGAAPIHWAIANGETRTGLTTMRSDAHAARAFARVVCADFEARRRARGLAAFRRAGLQPDARICAVARRVHNISRADLSHLGTAKIAGTPCGRAGSYRCGWRINFRSLRRWELAGAGQRPTRRAEAGFRAGLCQRGAPQTTGEVRVASQESGHPGFLDRPAQDTARADRVCPKPPFAAYSN